MVASAPISLQVSRQQIRLFCPSSRVKGQWVAGLHWFQSCHLKSTGQGRDVPYVTSWLKKVRFDLFQTVLSIVSTANTPITRLVSSLGSSVTPNALYVATAWSDSPLLVRILLIFLIFILDSISRYYLFLFGTYIMFIEQNGTSSICLKKSQRLQKQ